MRRTAVLVRVTLMGAMATAAPALALPAVQLPRGLVGMACSDTIGRASFAGLPGQGGDVPSDISSIKITIRRVQQPERGYLPQFGPLTLCKPVDANSPRLFLAAATLTLLTSTRIEVFRPNTSTPALVYRLQDSYVSGYRFVSAGEDVLCEEIELDYCNVEVTSFPDEGPPSSVIFDRCHLVE